MAEIKAFKGLRFTEKAGKIDELVCPPYDIISPEQKKAYLAENPNNVIRLELPEGDDPYLSAKNVLTDFLEKGILKTDEKEGIYVYRETFNIFGETKEITALIARIKLHEFSEGVVLPHENTLSKAKEDRFNLMKATFCNFSQIYSLFDDNGDTEKTLDEICKGTPVCDFDFDGINQKLWCVYDEETISALEKQFENRQLFIADGHHRYETALRFKKYCADNGIDTLGAADYCMMALVSFQSKGLVVLPTHRIVKNVGFKLDEFLKKAEEKFTVEKIDKKDVDKRMKEGYEKAEKCFTLCAGENYLLTLKEKSEKLDVDVLQDEVLDGILGITREKVTAGGYLFYTRDEAEAFDCKSVGGEVAFIINPTRVEEIKNCALAGGKMPQKSTYFQPKLITGLVMNKIK